VRAPTRPISTPPPSQGNLAVKAAPADDWSEF
jgi:hypothetical protein